MCLKFNKIKPIIALCEKLFHRIMIHSKNYLSALVGRKCVICCLKTEPYQKTKITFGKVHCNIMMHCKMHFTVISQSLIWWNIVYYTELKQNLFRTQMILSLSDLFFVFLMTTFENCFYLGSQLAVIKLI